ncbi:MAG: hypothetical protein Q9176_000294 [Flavoplaca citrina]
MLDGRWTTRTLDIHQILARNREEKQEMANGSPAEPGRPALGILTKTLVRSPVIKSIIPARVRHRSRNDVVFVYDDAIVIKEILGGERIEHDPFSPISLADVIEKKDFDSPLQAVRILGLPREPKVPRFPGKDWSKHSDADRSQSSIETKPNLLHENEVPPQILVLTLASRNLLFLFAYHDVHEQVHFLSNTFPLPAQAAESEELGVHLAVDPKWISRNGGGISRKSYCDIYPQEHGPDKAGSAETAWTGHEEFHANTRRETHQGDEHYVILLLIISKGDSTLLVRFEWDCRGGLSGVERKPSQVLPKSKQLPNLLIPLIYRTSFAVVSGEQVTIYEGILTGIAQAQDCQLELHEQREVPRNSDRPLTWTHWARPMRPTKRLERGIDNIYLCREDGVVCYIDVREDSRPMISSSHSAGILKTNLSNAFATLDLGRESNDVVIAASETGDGGLWYLRPREPIVHVGTIRNWTPFRDITIAPFKTSTSRVAESDKQIRRKAKRPFACSGRGPRHGAITEVRMGTEAVKLGPTIELSELANNGILDLWALPYPVDQDRQAASEAKELSLNEDTIAAGSTAEGFIVEDPSAASGVEELSHNERTIAAGSTAEGFIVQVTPSSINAISQKHGILPLAWHPEGASISVASLLTIPNRTTVLLIVLCRHHDYYLHHGHFGSQGGHIIFEALGEQVRLPSEASSLALHWFENCIIAFVGTVAATLQIYTARAGLSLNPYFEYRFGDPSSICDSLAILTTEIQTVACDEVEIGQLVLCGLRNGTVKTLWLNSGQDSHNTRLFSKENEETKSPGSKDNSLGEGIHFLGRSTGSSDGAWSKADAPCRHVKRLPLEQTLYTVEYLGGASPTNPASVNKLWVTDPNLQAFQQGPATSIAQASSNIPHGCSKFAAGSLFYLSGSSLVVADISSFPRPEMVPRRLPLNGTPTTVLYSEHLDKLIVMYTTEVHQRGKRLRKGMAVQRTAPQPAIALVELDAEPVRLDLDGQDGPNILDSSCVLPGEKFLGLVEWLPTVGERQHYMLVVHTATGQAGSQATISRLLFFSLINDAGSATLKIDMEHKAEICAVAPYGRSSLVYGCGNDILLRFLDVESKKFRHPMKLTLRSPAVHISVKGLDIHVSTESHGHHILSVVEDKLVARWADRVSRPSAYHLVLPEQSLVLATDLDCRIAGLWQPPQPHLDRTAPLIFEAFLPRSITRLCRIQTQKDRLLLTQPEPQTTYSTSPINAKIGNGIVARAERYLSKENLLATCEDGTIYQLSLLDQASWRLLAYIQNMAMREPRICPYPHPRVGEQDLEPSMARKRDMHIDGDILTRLLERGGRRLLEEMLDEGASGRMLLDEMLVEDLPEDRWHRFLALTKEVFGGEGAVSPNSDMRVPNGELAESVLGWLRLLLMPAI